MFPCSISSRKDTGRASETTPVEIPSARSISRYGPLWPGPASLPLAPALHELDRRLEELEILLVLRGVGAVDLDPLLGARHAAGLERGHVLARELQVPRGRCGKAKPHAVAADAGEHAVVDQVRIEAADLLGGDTGKLEEHGVDLRLAGVLAVVGGHE